MNSTCLAPQRLCPVRFQPSARCSRETCSFCCSTIPSGLVMARSCTRYSCTQTALRRIVSTISFWLDSVRPLQQLRVSTDYRQRCFQMVSWQPAPRTALLLHRPLIFQRLGQTRPQLIHSRQCISKFRAQGLAIQRFIANAGGRWSEQRQ